MVKADTVATRIGRRIGSTFQGYGNQGRFDTLQEVGYRIVTHDSQISCVLRLGFGRGLSNVIPESLVLRKINLDLGGIAWNFSSMKFGPDELITHITEWIVSFGQFVRWIFCCRSRSSGKMCRQRLSILGWDW